jgi:hypothetical protein
MNRPQIFDQADVRSYDHLWGWRDMLYATSSLVQAILGGTTTVASGLAATPTGPASLTINIAAGQIYQLGQVDATAYGSLTADTTQVLQQGLASAQTVLLSTAGLSTGQSRWALIQANFAQVDDIPSDDPNGGLLPFVNPSNPSGPPWSGPNNTGTMLNTRRMGVCNISVVYGNAASTGTEVPPNASAGCVGLYLIDLAFGQTAVSSGQIKVAGPSVGTGVPSNYPVAPFLSGLLNGHHNGKAGQAPQINLASEVAGVLPRANIAAWNGLSSIGVKTASYTVLASDFGGALFYSPSAAANGTFTIPNGTTPGDMLTFLNRTASWTLTVQMAAGATGAIIGFGVNGSSFTIAPNDDAVLFWSGTNWHILYWSGAFGLQDYKVINDANYTILTTDFQKYVILDSGATAPRTFFLSDGITPGDLVYIANASTAQPLTLQVGAGSAAHFFGPGMGVGVSSFTLQGQDAFVVWTGSNWHVGFYTGTFDLAGVVTTFNGVGSAALVHSASQLTTGSTYSGSSFTGFGLSGTWKCITSAGPAGGLYFSLITRTA